MKLAVYFPAKYESVAVRARACVCACLWVRACARVVCVCACACARACEPGEVRARGGACKTGPGLRCEAEGAGLEV
jgi:hypothetical protein